MKDSYRDLYIIESTKREAIMKLLQIATKSIKKVEKPQTVQQISMYTETIEWMLDLMKRKIIEIAQSPEIEKEIKQSIAEADEKYNRPFEDLEKRFLNRETDIVEAVIYLQEFNKLYREVFGK